MPNFYGRAEPPVYKQIVRTNFDKYKGPGSVRIAGIMGVCDFPLAPLMAIKLGQNVDYLVIRYDCYSGGIRKPACGGGVMGTNGKGGDYHFNLLTKLNPFTIPVEHLYDVELRRAGDGLLSRLVDVQPEFVFQCDSDECYPDNFGPGFWEDFKKFEENEKAKFIKFDWEMETIDGRPVPLAPICRHVKVYRWHPEVNYTKGAGFAQPYFPKPVHYMQAEHKMKHWWTFTEELEDAKIAGYVKGRPHVVEQIYFHGGAYEKWMKKYRHTMKDMITERRPDLVPEQTKRDRRKKQ